MPVETQRLDPRIADFLKSSGLATGAFAARPLTGGVASDIWKVTAFDRTFVVKMALPRLRVAEEWTVPVSRNASEVAWLREAERIVPGAVPQILEHDEALGVFAMSFLEPDEHPTWKAELRAGRADSSFASALGRTIASIHAGTAYSDEVAARFDNDALFQIIRLEPYFEATAGKHPEVASIIRSRSAAVLATKQALVHGDVSPKNILVGPAGPVIIDAECAWYGEPAFDIAFCLNHLLLKGVWVRDAASRFLDCYDALSSAYLDAVTWDSRDSLERRIAHILPVLLLARVDGKSPVEYITNDTDRDLVRRAAIAALKAQDIGLSQIRDLWSKELSQ